jgi:hypothetical protein
MTEEDELSKNIKKLAPHSEGYQYWVNGYQRLTIIHPNDWDFENPEGINYMRTYSGMTRPGVLFEGWNILRAIENADSLDELHKAISYEINRVDKIDREEFLTD